MNTRHIIAGIGLTIALVTGSEPLLAQQTVKPTATGTAAIKSAIRPAGFFQRLAGNLSWEEVKQTATSPRDISRQVRRKVKYLEDLGDEWSGGRETWERGYGDCEDMASAVADLCAEQNHQAWVQIFYCDNSVEGHAVAMGRINGRLWMSSNGFYYEIKSLTDAAHRIRRELGWKRTALIHTVTESEYRAPGWQPERMLAGR